MQAFSLSYDLSPPPSLLLSASYLSFSVFLCVSGLELTAQEKGEGAEEEPNYTTVRKPGPL